MSLKFNAVLKRQFSATANNIELESNSSEQEMQEIPQNLIQRNGEPMSLPMINETTVMLQGKHERNRATEFESVEIILDCGICEERLKTPKTLPCQHSFCLECLKDEFLALENNEEIDIACPFCNYEVKNTTIENLPTNAYIERELKTFENSRQTPRNKKSAVIRFAPSVKGREIGSETEKLETSICEICSRICEGEGRCKHCRQAFCRVCWPAHTNYLKDQLETVSQQLDSVSSKFDFKVNDFRRKIDAIEEFINKDIEQKINALLQEKEFRLKRTNDIASTCEINIANIKEKMVGLSEEVHEQRRGSYVALPDEQLKVSTYLTLQQKATEVSALATLWEPEIYDIEKGFNDPKERPKVTSKKNPKFFYVHKVFAPKIIAGHDMVQRPSGLTLDPWRDHVIVACPGSGQVVLLDKKFKLLKRIYHQDMMAPHGVAFHEQTEEIYVTDKWKHCIFVFNRRGDLLRRMCSKGSGKAQLRSPEGISFHPTQEKFYVADSGNDRIQILENDGTYVGSIGPSGKQASSVTRSGRIVPVVLNQLNQPTDVAVSTTAVAVADCGNHKIKIFDHNGQILQTYGRFGASRGFFKSPQVIFIDKEENVIVGDAGNGRVQIFSPAGELLRTLGGKGNATHQFGWVSGLLIKDNYDIIVADSKDNTIHSF